MYINYEGASGPVCDDFWDIADAHVACRQLGYQNGALQATSFSSFGTGTGFLLDDVECQGGEERLDLCYHGGIGNHNCFSFEVAGVICDSEQIHTVAIREIIEQQFVCFYHEFIYIPR